MTWKVPLFKIYSDDEDIEKISTVLKRGSYWCTGNEIEEFENKISDYIGTKYCALFNSGTSALHCILMSYGIGEGDEVIVPSFTFISTANSVLFVGAKPVFSEIENDTYGMDIEDVQNKITPKTKAIIPVHYGGCPAKYIRELKELAEDNKIYLFEDAAEAFGAKIDNKKIGTFGDSAMLSFCQNKIITTGEGGAVVTDSKDIYNKLKLLASHGREDKQNYFSTTDSLDYVTLGYNFRMPTMNAALGLSQIKKTDKLIKARRKNAKIYNNKLSSIDNVKISKIPDNYFSVYQLYTIQIKKGLRDKLKSFLENKGIFTKIYFDPVHLSKFYRNKFLYKEGDLPITEEISKNVLTIPMHPLLLEEEIDYVTSTIKNFFEEV